MCSWNNCGGCGNNGSCGDGCGGNGCRRGGNGWGGCGNNCGGWGWNNWGCGGSERMEPEYKRSIPKWFP